VAANYDPPDDVATITSRGLTLRPGAGDLNAAQLSATGEPPLRVVHVYKDVYPPIAGGIEKHIDTVRRAMPDVTSHVLVAARGTRTSVEHVRGGTEVRVAEFGRVLSVPLAPSFPRWLARLEADVIHVHMPHPLGELAALTSALGRPIIASYHADIVRQARLLPAYRLLADACLTRAFAIVAGSHRVVETSPILSRFADRTTVIPYAVDTSRYDPDAVPPSVRNHIRARFGEPLILSVGRLVYYKGFEDLIRAARRLDVNLVIVGDGPLAPILRAQSADLPNVHLVGSISEAEMPHYLAAADCFALASTSRAESFGIATLEAQAMGVPAVVTDVGTGTVEAIVPGETGLVVGPNDSDGLARAIDRILSDAPLREAMGNSARRRVQALHSGVSQAGRLRQLYLKAAGRSPAG
jgi:glycosyltransferase involved in cell wall biosynthesis